MEGVHGSHESPFRPQTTTVVAMYPLSESQINFIQQDILARGIQLESLQQDLLDHLCCVMENELTAEDDFETFYRQRITHFYKRDLREIEEETRTLLTFKNYYAMKKIMLLSGGLLAFFLVTGLVLKFLHLPGAAASLILGVAILNFVFLPLLVTLKIRENRSKREKLIAGLATLCGMLMSIGLIFKVMHWPGANALIVTGFGALLLLFLPVYFFTGVQNPETKINTIVSSVIILSSASLILILVRSPKATQDLYATTTASVLRSEQILNVEYKKLQELQLDQATTFSGNEVYDLCQQLKKHLIRSETGSNDLKLSEGHYLSEGSAEDYFSGESQAAEQLTAAENAIKTYNQSLPQGAMRLDEVKSIRKQRIADAINQLIQTQMMVLQNSMLQSKGA